MAFKKFLFKLTHWESWHHHIKYIPIAPLWIWYCIKARSVWFFTASNPTITFGGFEGEGKQEIYEQLPGETHPPSVFIKPGTSFGEIRALITHHGFEYPFIVKPDVGAMGYMFRKIRNEAELKIYHDHMPHEYMLQKLIDYPLEVSVFYYRMPNHQTGTVSGFLLKKQPRVTGDGASTLQQLIQQNKDLKFKRDEMEEKHRNRLQSVLPKGEEFILSHASNRSQGGKLISLSDEIDGDLVSLFDRISLYSRHFYYGRYDIKCRSIEEFKAGKNFYILEYNGAGAGIQHVYGNHLTLFQACRTIAKHWKMLYRISAYNHKNSDVQYWNFEVGRKLLVSAMKHLKELKKLDNSLPF